MKQSIISVADDPFEAAATLSSLRAAPTASLYLLKCQARDATPGQTSKIGCEVSRGTKTVRMNGSSAKTTDLVSALPVQAIDPEIHQLIQGGPEQRRRFLDWGVFHVEHDYIATWRAYKTALKQRNAALKAQLPNATIEAWDDTLIKNAISLDIQRKTFISDFKKPIVADISRNIPIFVECQLFSGLERGRRFQRRAHGQFST